MNRINAVKILMQHVPKDALVISVNGYISREVFSSFDRAGNFYMLGSMGMGLPIALGLAYAIKKRKIVVLDGDGNLLMNMGSLSTVARLHPRNLVHIVLDNEAYESTGGQPSSSRYVDLKKVAEVCGYEFAARAETVAELEKYSRKIFLARGPIFLLVKIREVASPSGRINIKPEEIVRRFKKNTTGWLNERI